MDTRRSDAGHTVHLTVNGLGYTLDGGDLDLTLLQYLRDRLGLTAAKNGCGEGTCGACTVLVDGQARHACKVPVVELDGTSVETLEHLSDGVTIHAIQYAFLVSHAIQCGFCTPGMIMAVKGLLDKDADPCEAAVKHALGANICRCTGYTPILQAVDLAAKLIQQGKSRIAVSQLMDHLGQRVGVPGILIDGLAKATGELKYADDLYMEHMLWAKVLRSAYAHARISGIDVSQARACKGVVGVLTAQDIQGTNRFGVLVADQPVLAEDEVLWMGEAIAVVYAESPRQAQYAVERIRVDYVPLPVAGSPLDMATPPMGYCVHKESNLSYHLHLVKGSPEEAFRKAAVVVEDVYTTACIEHGYLEPESCVALPDGSGGILLYSASQGPYVDKPIIAKAVGMPVEKLHIRYCPMGGGFGGKEDITVQILAVLGALATHQPVKYAFTRLESIISSTKRHAYRMHYRTAASADGRITALQASLIADKGAYESVGKAVLTRSVSFAGGPYAIGQVEVEAQSVYSNTNPSGAMRGFGNPQVTFACEVQMSRIADSLGMDQVEFRIMNALDTGSETITGEVLGSSVGIKACLEAVQKSLGRTVRPADTPYWKTGVGVAASYKNVGIGIGVKDSAAAVLAVRGDGVLELRIGAIDMGQGSNTAMAQLVAGITGWPVSRIAVFCGDTDDCPSAGMTSGSKQTFLTGNAVQEAAQRLNRSMIALVADVAGKPADGVVLLAGSFIAKQDGTVLAKIGDIAALMENRGVELKEAYVYHAPDTYFALGDTTQADVGQRRLHYAYCFAAQAFIIQVNILSGQVRIVQVIAASDVGKALNPALIEGQMTGGIVMGIGYALSEEYRVQDGVPQTTTFASLGIPTIQAVPAIECHIIENPHPEGPMGAKGMSELTVSLAAPAIVSAIHDALGVWITTLPATPGRVLEALKSKQYP